MSAERIPVGVLGATGAVGQRFIQLLENHPLFELRVLAASERSAGKRYGEACSWRLAGRPPEGLAERVLAKAEPNLPCRVLFSALDSGSARELEPRFAEAGYAIFTNAAALRMEEDVPLLVPEVNASHAALLDLQRARRSWKRGVVANANCSATQLALALAPLDRAFGVEKAVVTTMQAVSGAGYPGVPSLDILGNVVPDIPQEADKIETETRKILGTSADGRVVPAPLTISARTFRVPVEEGHTQSVSVLLSREARREDLIDCWRSFRASPAIARLPSSPERPIDYCDASHSPQPRRDAETGGGMTVVVGGLEPCPVLSWRFVVVSHNTIRGAAGGSILNAESIAAGAAS